MNIATDSPMAYLATWLQVTSIDYAGNGREPCKVMVAGGPPLAADLVLVTVPLGVLKSNTLGFNPPLPKWKQAAIEKLVRLF